MGANKKKGKEKAAGSSPWSGPSHGTQYQDTPDADDEFMNLGGLVEDDEEDNSWDNGAGDWNQGHQHGSGGAANGDFDTQYSQGGVGGWSNDNDWAQDIDRGGDWPAHKEKKGAGQKGTGRKDAGQQKRGSQGGRGGGRGRPEVEWGAHQGNDWPMHDTNGRDTGGNDWGRDVNNGWAQDDDDDDEAADPSGRDRPGHLSWAGQDALPWGELPDPPATARFNQSDGWRNWDAEARQMGKGTSRPPPPSATAPTVGTRNLVDVDQRQQILNAFTAGTKQPNTNSHYESWGTGQTKGGKGGKGGSSQRNGKFDQWGPLDQSQQEQQKSGKKGKKNKQEKQEKQEKPEKRAKQEKTKQQLWSQQTTEGWGDDKGWDQTIPEEEDAQDEVKDDGYGWGRKVHFSHSSRTMDDFTPRQRTPSYTMPSKTLAHAYQGTTTSLHRGSVPNTMADYANFEFIESKGHALQRLEGAILGTSSRRMAKDRIHWMFPADKDERVSSALAWVQSVSYDLGALSVHKFLQSRERGALMVNADYRPTDSSSQFTVDWMTFDQLRQSRDRILQESVAFYDPAMQGIVFVCLPSKTGNSVAMWRRKVKVPNNVRLGYQQHIKVAMGALRKEYVVHVDELPKTEPKKEPPARKPRLLSKRKWWPKILS